MQRPQGRLNNRSDTRPRLRIPPRLKRRALGQNPVCLHGGLVGKRCSRNDRANLFERFGKAGSGRKRVDRIGIMNHEYVDFARLHLLDESHDGLHRIRSPGHIAYRHLDCATDGTKQTIEKQYCREPPRPHSTL